MSDYVDNVANDLDRHILFNMPLRKAVVLFSALFFVIIALGSSIAYYFSMRQILNQNLIQEIRQTLHTKQLQLKTELDKEVLLLKLLSEKPVIKEYLSNPDNEQAKEESFALLDFYKKYFQNDILNWVNKRDSIYYVNGQSVEKIRAGDANFAWFFEALKTPNPPVITVDFDNLNRHVYDLYMNYPVYSKAEAVGVISGRISLIEFINKLRLPKNILIFDENGIIIGAADENIVKEKKTLKDLFGAQGEEVLKKAQIMGKSENIALNLDDGQYVVSSMEKLDLFFVAKEKVDAEKIFKEKATMVFFALLLLMLLVFIVFNNLISRILKPINKYMMAYIETSLLDELTKLPNRRFFNMRIEDEWNRAVRGKNPLSFLMMDLDKFKSYNDKHGHLEGDRLLREVARVFSFCVNRTSDFAARFGGEEFCVILPNTSIDGARKIAENIRVSMERTGKATISIGMVCKIPDLEDNMQSFIDLADQKLYEAKNSGRNKVCG